MLIFKIICIIILIVLIIVCAIGTWSFSKYLYSNKCEENNDVSTAKYLCKLGWALLIAYGTILIYVIMN